MVDVSSQNNSVSINVSTGGNSASIKATPDMAQYYSEKSREWAISNRIVDNTDYSSKHYAEQSQLSAKEANNYERSVIEKYNSFIDVSNQAESEIQTLRDKSISELSNAKNLGIADINNALNKNLEEAKASIEENKANTIEEIETLGNEALSDIKAQGIESRANLDLSNLSEVGEKHFLGKSQITNCITEIPQRIKLELTDGTLTLKAGSEVIVPNGFEEDGVTPKFDYITVENDSDWYPSDIAGTRFGYYFFTQNTLANSIIEYTYSGNTATMNSITPYYYAFFYNIETNKIYKGSGEAWVESPISLPVCLFKNDSTATVTSLDQVFNGMGYIGSTIWVDKGVKGLIPNGRNEDGTLKNIEYTTSKLATFSNPNYSNVGVWFSVKNDGELTLQGTLFTQNQTPAQTYSFWYNPVENFIYESTNTTNFVKTPMFICGQFDRTKGTDNPTISNLKPKQPFRAVDYNDKSEISSWAMPSDKYIDLTVNASGASYTAPANGYFRANFQASNKTGFVQMYGGVASGMTANDGRYSLTCFVPVLKGSQMVMYYGNGTFDSFYFVYAEGEA